jgi:hypothetical protein
MVRRVVLVVVLAAVAAAATGLVYNAVSSPTRLSPDAPRALERPTLVLAGRPDDEVQINPYELTWRSPVRGVPFRLRYSWLACNLRGAHCSPLAGLHGKTIVTPQEQRIVTLRGVVTGTNRYGSRSVVSRNFYYDMAGLPFNLEHRRFLHEHLQYNPAQLRAWYGLGPEEDGAGQTIMIPDFGRVHEQRLTAAVDHFSAHYGLPRICRAARRRDCFHLAFSQLGRRPTDTVRGGGAEAAADVEWAHAIAPRARIVFVQFDHLTALFGRLGGLAPQERPSVVSDSWCDPCGGRPGEHFPRYLRDLVFAFVANGCHHSHVVCVQAAGDHRIPGDPPSNSPYVLAVGGTKFEPTPDGTPGREALWPFSGSGVTDMPVKRPSWQRHVRDGCSISGGDFSCTKRAVPDVSATAAAVPVAEPGPYGPEWIYFTGTSLSTPLWAGLIALADQQLRKDGQPAMGINELHQALYRGEVGSGLDDIPPRGWDWNTGVGSPKSGIVPALAGAIERYRSSR